MLGIVPYQGQAGTLEHVGQSYAPVQSRPSTLTEWYRRMQALENPYPAQETKLQASVSVVRHNAEGAALAALLGFISGEFGLDIRGKYPVDGIGAFLLAALSISRAGQPDSFSSDLRAMSQTCTDVFFFRQAERWRKASKVINTQGEESMNIHTPKKPTVQSHSLSNDPILEAGRRAGL